MSSSTANATFAPGARLFSACSGPTWRSGIPGRPFAECADGCKPARRLDRSWQSCRYLFRGRMPPSFFSSTADIFCSLFDDGSVSFKVLRSHLVLLLAIEIAEAVNLIQNSPRRVRYRRFRDRTVLQSVSHGLRTCIGRKCPQCPCRALPLPRESCPPKIPARASGDGFMAGPGFSARVRKKVWDHPGEWTVIGHLARHFHREPPG